MIFISVAGQVLFYGQLYTIIINKSADNVSLLGFACGFVSQLSWLIYGYRLRDTPLIISGGLGAVGAILTIISIIIYN